MTKKNKDHLSVYELRVDMIAHQKQKRRNFLLFVILTPLAIAASIYIFDIPLLKYVRGDEGLAEIAAALILGFWCCGMHLCHKRFKSWQVSKKQHEQSVLDYEQRTLHIEGGELSLEAKDATSGQLTKVAQKGQLSKEELNRG